MTGGEQGPKRVPWWWIPFRLSATATHLLAVLSGFPEPQFPYLQNGYNISIYLIALVRKLKRKINIMCLALWSMEHRKYTMTGVIIAVIIAIRLIILRGPT